MTNIGDAEEINVATQRADGTLSAYVPIWVVRVYDEMFVRSFRGPKGAWYQRAIAQRSGAVRVGATTTPVTCTPVGAGAPELRARIDSAYQSKYGRYGESYLKPMLSDAVAATTLRIELNDQPNERTSS